VDEEATLKIMVRMVRQVPRYVVQIRPALHHSKSESVESARDGE